MSVFCSARRRLFRTDTAAESVSVFVPSRRRVPSRHIEVIYFGVRFVSTEMRIAVPDDESRRVMEWWGWVTVALVIIVAIVLAVVVIQAKRRSGGVIITGGPGKTAGPDKP